MLQVGDTATLCVFYSHTVFEDENFRILSVFATYEENLFPFPSNDKKVEFIVKGLMSAPDYQYQELELTGEWRYDQSYKQYTLSVEYVIPTLPTTEKGVFRFCKSIHGIGDKVAKRISSILKNGFLLPTGKEPDVDWFIASIKGMTPGKASNLHSAIRRVNASAELTKILKGCVSGQVVRNIAARYGTCAVDTVIKTPYKLFVDRVVSFKSADTIAMTVGKDATDKERIRAGIIDQVRQRKGRLNSIIVEKEIVLQNALQVLNIPEDLIMNEFNDMMGKNLVSAAKYCYLREDFETERGLAMKIAEYIEGAKKIAPSDVTNYLNNFEEWKKENAICLADRQELAVKAVASNLVSVLTGGPGTGKTTVLKAIMETYHKSFPNCPITLMAPAGLAAKRMASACGAPALTIHKTLGLIPADNDAGFDDSDGLSIDGGLVIVDEVSMVGIHLAKFLFDAVILKPDTRIVLVGDVDQLPPVSPGAVLDDLISCNRVTVTRLNRNFRQEAGSAIVDAAYAINEGTGVFTHPRLAGVEGATLSSLVSSGTVTDTFQFGPAFLMNGEISPSGGGRAQRTFIGTNGAPGDIWIVVTEGRGSDGVSAGLTMQECAEFLKAKGCTFGIPLDGGGSTTMVFNGMRLNHVGSERAVVDFVYFR